MDDDDDGSVRATAGPAPSSSPPTRIIIALDLDAFYVAASRKRDPSLQGLPVGIKQKHILATVSYEARARGVKKLALIRDAVRQCPELVLVNGEDLTYFRKVSQDIFHLVSSMVQGGLVEKLGMDELFCDVTEMVEEMYRAAHTSTFPPPFGIVLPEQTQHALLQNGNRTHDFDPVTQRLLLATHLAHRIRDRVAHEAGLTCSAGIATSKYLAKLVGNVNKPNRQTVFAPLDAHSSDDVQRFLDPYPVRALNGFGSAITAKMCDAAIETMGVPASAASKERMTVLVARQIFDHGALQHLFGARLADRLHGLLHGIDDEPVVRAPDYPAQISIEDTYQGLPFHDAAEQFHILSQSLLRRLETELVARAKDHAARSTTSDQDAFSVVELPFDSNGDLVGSIDEAALRVRDYKETTAATTTPLRTSSTWLRYPMSMRLSVRQGYTNRITRQTRMPVEVFNLTAPRAERAAVLARSCQALFRAILAVEGDRGEGLNLINIAALDLQVRNPAAQSIGRFFQAAVHPSEPATSTAAASVATDEQLVDQDVSGATAASAIDMAFLLELPADIRAEVAAEYGITLDESTAESTQPLAQSSQASGKTDTSTASSSATTYVCTQCGQHMSPYLQHDHQRWPRTGLAPDHSSASTDEVLWDDDDGGGSSFSCDDHQRDSD